jgi:GAF domain-containing protein
MRTTRADASGVSGTRPPKQPRAKPLSDASRPTLSNQDLEALYELAVELLQLEDYELMLDTLVQRSLELLHAERGFLVLLRGPGLDFKVVRNWSTEELRGGQEIVSHCFSSPLAPLRSARVARLFRRPAN